MQSIINQFSSEKNIAIIGVSRNEAKWGNMLYDMLSKKGYTIFPVNPNMKEYKGNTCYASVKDLPAEVQNAIFTIPAKATEQVLKDITESSIKRVWLHKGGGQGASSEEAIQICNRSNIPVVYGLCPMMFFPDAGIHKIHLFFKRLFGGMPADYRN